MWSNLIRIGTHFLQSFPTTKGEFLHIELHPDDDLDKGHDLQRVYFRCQGNDTSRPTLILDDGEGIANWLGLLDAAEAAQTDLRVCVWDHLGFGHSDYAYLDQLRDSGPFYNVGTRLFASCPSGIDPICWSLGFVLCLHVCTIF